MTPQKVGAKGDRLRKWLSGVFHDQDWERFEASVCLAFGHKVLYGQISHKAISFQTVISPDPDRQPMGGSDKPTKVPSSRMFGTESPQKKGSPVKKSGFPPRVKTLLAFDDPIPVYDARRVVVDFDADLDRLQDILPIFRGEVPVGSFAAVGYSCSSYAGTVNGMKVPNLGLNIMWVIVCGVPPL
ncbi:hypothetical protein B0H10DRAFT_2225707 [Mycena sp. CBHHK59/15]|nr:hypothetical protein B0H10DRAFT_2225707 [Mycena sp. CBHHK59/15]